MAISNDSVLITPGSGATIASHNPGDAKEYQVIMLADPNGVLVNSLPSYRLVIPSAAVGASKVYFDLFNATGSAKIMKIKTVTAYVDSDTAVTGTLGVELELTRTTAVGTGGTAATNDSTSLTAPSISRFDTNDSVVPVQITARALPTAGATGGAYLGSRWVFTEETSAPGGIAGNLGAALIKYDDPDLIVRENSGIRIIQGTVASVGNIAFEVDFELQ